MDLFEHSQTGYTPLAEKLRPKEIHELLLPHGQRSKINSYIRNAKASNYLPNLILWGPPGTGKTSLALLLAQLIKGEFININAVDTGAKKLKEIGETAKRNKTELNIVTVVFIDEIHRLNKAQQDVLLPFTEKSNFILIGATTENPSYELNSALISRSQVLIFEPLSQQNLTQILKNGLSNDRFKPVDILTPEALDLLVNISSGDARQALNLAEQVLNYFDDKNAQQPDQPLKALSVDDLSVLLNRPVVKYDKSADEHYNCISAFIKSIRGSDPDAGLYYLARMIEGGEDLKFIARRLIILASEDIGNADPRALTLATSGMDAAEKVGLPEAGIILAQVVTYLASAPKSNSSYLGYKKALNIVRQTGALLVPMSLKSAQTQFNKNLGHGADYKYTHNSPTGWIEQSYLPNKIKDEVFYEPSNRAFEKNITEYLKWVKQKG